VQAATTSSHAKTVVAAVHLTVQQTAPAHHVLHAKRAHSSRMAQKRLMVTHLAVTAQLMATAMTAVAAQQLVALHLAK
jgi:hypothetical protein